MIEVVKCWTSKKQEWIISYKGLKNNSDLSFDLGLTDSEYIWLIKEQFEFNIYVANINKVFFIALFEERELAQKVIDELIIPKLVAKRLRGSHG